MRSGRSVAGTALGIDRQLRVTLPLHPANEPRAPIAAAQNLDAPLRYTSQFNAKAIAEVLRERS